MSKFWDGFKKVAGTILSDVVPVVGPLIGSFLGSNDNEQAREDTAKQNALDRQFQLDMWNKTNAYNTPMEQMNRLRSAGINPATFYGSGSGANTTSTFTPMMSKPLPYQNRGEIFNSALNQYHDLSRRPLENDLLVLDAAGKAAMTAKVAAETEKTTGVDTDLTRAQVDKTKTDTILSHYQTGKVDADTDLSKQELLTRKLEYDKAQKLFDTSVDAQMASLKNIELRNKEQEIVNSQLPEKHKQFMFESYAKLKQAQATLSETQFNNALKSEILDMRRKGIEVNDGFLWRFFSEFLPEKAEIRESMTDKKVGEHNAFMDLIRMMTGSKKNN